MKQKNLILMVVAVGCGLVAAFLTSQMSGKPRADTSTVDVIVAAKELIPGTQFTKDSLKDQVKRRKMDQKEVPQNAILGEDELVDKQLTVTVKADEMVRVSDLGQYKPLDPPAGKNLVTIKLPLDKVTPFVKPGSKVDLVGTIISRAGGVVKGTVLIPSMLVMAVDLQTRAPDSKAEGAMNIQVITLAASSEEGQLIRLAEIANVQMSFILLNTTDTQASTKNWSADAVIKWVNEAIKDGSTGGGPTPPNTPAPTPAAETPKIQVSVPKEDIPAGTELTAEVIKEKFRTADIAALPDNVVQNIQEHVGKFALSDLYRDAYVNKKQVGPKPGKAAPEETPTPKPAAETPKPKAPPKETFDRNYTTPSGTKVVRFQKDDKGDWKLLGEVKDDGTVVPLAGGVQGQPKPPEADDKEKKPAEDDAKPANPKIT